MPFFDGQMLQQLGGLDALLGPGQDPGWLQTLERLPQVWLEFVTLLLAFTLAILVLLTFGVRALMVARKLPVPVDPFDMARPRGFRTLMLSFAVLLAPLVAREFLPLEGMDPGWALAVAYVLAILLGVVIWLLLELFYKVRKTSPPTR